MLEHIEIQDYCLEQLIKKLNQNYQMVSCTLDEICHIKERDGLSRIEIVEAPSTVTSFQHFHSSHEKQFYLSSFRTYSFEEFCSQLEKIMPNQGDFHFSSFLKELLMEMNQELEDIYSVLNEDLESLSILDLQDLKKDILVCEMKKSYLQRRIDETSSMKHSSYRNHMIFVPAISGNTSIMDDFKEIPVEYYGSFLGLFQSILDGSFKNIKRFSDNKKLRGILEVKDFKTRVAFSRISGDYYAVIMAFMKKSDNDTGYRRSLEARVANYRTCQSYLKEQLMNADFLKLNQEYQEELLRMLGAQDEKPKAFVKSPNS